MAYSILIVDDHPICGAALTMAAHAIDQAAAVRVAATLAQAEALLAERAPDLVLLDLMLPDVQGFAGLALVRALAPGIPVAVVSSRDEDAVVRKAVALGARGFIPKSSPMDRMIAGIRALLAGGQWFPDAALAEPAAADDIAVRMGSLSVAQLRVLRAVADGAPTKRIAFDLSLAEATVKTHLAAIFRKLDVDNRTQAVVLLRAFDGEARPPT